MSFEYGQRLLETVRVYGVWRVAVEFAVIACFVYAVLSFLRGTRGGRLLRGMGLVVLVSYLVVRVFAAKFSLERLDFLYGRMLFLIGFAAIVVFQAELRRAFMLIGEAGVLRILREDPRRTVDAIAASAAYLSSRRVGMLVAIERNISLDEIARDGVRIDAVISAPLLNTIFWPNSALHDLGVVVRHDRVSHAAVQFPLTEAATADVSLGSRHRAALALSQETDAVIVVVSEETGDISLAHNGEMERAIKPADLPAALALQLGVKRQALGEKKP